MYIWICIHTYPSLGSNNTHKPKEKGNQNCTGIGSHDGSFRVDSWRISTVSPHLQVNQARVPATREGGPVHVSK